jgi:hypothetical protein
LINTPKYNCRRMSRNYSLRLRRLRRQSPKVSATCTLPVLSAEYSGRNGTGVAATWLASGYDTIRYDTIRWINAAASAGAGVAVTGVLCYT